MLKTLLADKMHKERLSSRNVAELTGVSHTTIQRILKGDNADLDTVVALGKWLKVRPAALLGYEDESLETDVAALIQYVPGLEDIFKQATKAIKDGRASPELLKDIVAYANYKLSTEVKK